MLPSGLTKAVTSTTAFSLRSAIVVAGSSSSTLPSQGLHQLHIGFRDNAQCSVACASQNFTNVKHHKRGIVPRTCTTCTSATYIPLVERASALGEIKRGYAARLGPRVSVWIVPDRMAVMSRQTRNSSFRWATLGLLSSWS